MINSPCPMITSIFTIYKTSMKIIKKYVNIQLSWVCHNMKIINSLIYTYIEIYNIFTHLHKHSHRYCKHKLKRKKQAFQLSASIRASLITAAVFLLCCWSTIYEDKQAMQESEKLNTQYLQIIQKTNPRELNWYWATKTVGGKIPEPKICEVMHNCYQI